MLNIAIIQFPGLNTEYETRREIDRAGMRGEFFRWNADNAASKLSKFDGFVIGGGFSYEDRGRAGIIASLDPIMEIIKKEAAKGKPVLGICNGAQILVETGLVPGADGLKLAMALARNRRIRDKVAPFGRINCLASPRLGLEVAPTLTAPAGPLGLEEVLGTGYYNAWVNLKCVSAAQRCMFTWNLKPGEIIRAPIAHGEGRFTTQIPDLINTLSSKGQMVFRYCDANGVIMENFPVNPNGAMFNLAAVCNPEGNVMAIMPHLERDNDASYKLFTSMRDAIMARKTSSLKKRTSHLHLKEPSMWPLPSFTPAPKTLQMFVSLIITDNEAETFELTLPRLGFPNIKLRRATHFELSYQKKPDLQKLMRKLIQSGVLLNTNKESTTVQFPKERLYFDAKREKFARALEHEDTPTTLRLLVRERDDYIGMGKTAIIQKRLKLEEIISVRVGTLWEIHIPTKSMNVAQEQLRKLIATHIFFNPHRQEAFIT